MFCVKIDGKRYWEIENTEATSFRDVKIFAGDEWYIPANGKIRNLTVSTKFAFSDIPTKRPTKRPTRRPPFCFGPYNNKICYFDNEADLLAASIQTISN